MKVHLGVCGLIAVVSLLACVPQGFAAAYPASICKEDGAAGHFDYHATGLLENESTSSSVFAMCSIPVMSDYWEFGYYTTVTASPLTSLTVRVRDGSDDEQLSCTATRRRMSTSGVTYAVSSSTDSVGSSAATVATETLDLSFSSTDMSLALRYFYNVSCSLPADDINTSRIYAINAPYEEVI
jgi:hypothetical protein